MELLKQRIQKDGEVRAGNILKVDSFLNHRMDITLFKEMGREFYEYFGDRGVTKILTIEASGIGIACIAALYFDVPVVYAKKHPTKNIAGDVYSVEVTSFTHGRSYNVIVSKRFLSEDDNVLIIDDFLANGCAARGLADIVTMAGGRVAGVGIAIEKGFQAGGENLRAHGLDVKSLAIVESMEDGRIVFRD